MQANTQPTPVPIHELPTIEQVFEMRKNATTVKQEIEVLGLIQIHLAIIAEKITGLSDKLTEADRKGAIADDLEQFIRDCKANA